MAHANPKDDLDDLTPREIVEAINTDLKNRSETAFRRNLPLLNADPNNPCAKDIAIHKYRDEQARKNQLRTDDKAGHAKADKAIAEAIAKMEAIDAEARKNNLIGGTYRDYGNRLKNFEHENRKAVFVHNPIVPASEPSMKLIKELRLKDAELEKAYERLENMPVPKADALAASDARVDHDHNIFNPSVFGFISRHRDDKFEWPHTSRPNRAMEEISDPNGGEALCWLFPEKVKERLREKIEASYKARGTEGMSRAQLKVTRQKINLQRLAVQREEHSHVLGLEAQGMMVDWRPDLSIFTVFQFSVPGITTLRGRGSQFEFPW